MTVFKSESIAADIFTTLMKRNAIRESQNKLNDVLQLFEQWVSSQKVPPIADKHLLATIKFTKQEIAQMSKSFQKTFKSTGGVARVVKTMQKEKALYEINYRRNGYNLTASSTNLSECKQKFIKETQSF